MLLVGCSSSLCLFPNVVFWLVHVAVDWFGEGSVVMGNLVCSVERGVWFVMWLFVRNW